MSAELRERRTSKLRFLKEDPAINGSKSKQSRLRNRRSQVRLGASAQADAATSIAKAAEQGVPSAKVSKRRYDKAATGLTTAKLRLAQMRRPSKIMFNTAAAPGRLVKSRLQNKLREYDADNSGVAALHGAEAAGEAGANYTRSKYQRQRNRAAKRKAKEADSGLSSNPISRAIQKRKIRRGYMTAKSGKTAAGTAHAVNRASGFAARAGSMAKDAGKAVVKKAGKPVLILLGIGASITFLLTSLTSCVSMIGGAGAASSFGAYASEDTEILAAEAAYCQMETDIQVRLDRYEVDHDYDEYHFELDEIGHDPYVLISLISSMYEGPWTYDQVKHTVQEIFARQYILTETVTTQTQTHTETDEDGNESEVSETYYICSVTLKNFNLSHLPVYMLNEDELGLYAVYMKSLGCRPDLFPNSEYVGRYGDGSYLDYAIPTEALEDEVFTAMMAEGRKYLGYPYVWGGSSPSTSFDCSGFVSWVINHSGWNVGRLSAQGLCNICTPTSTPHPGDLVFFVGTYDTNGVSHVGIYVGNNMMLHCGDPISFADLSSSYWQQHFYCYGRLP